MKKVDYRVYHLSFGKRVFCFLAGALIGAALGYIFYGMLFMSVVAAAGVGFFAVPFAKKWLWNRRQEQLKEQFRNMLEMLSTAIGSGEVAYQAFHSARKSLAEQYSDSSYIVKELDEILAGVESNINLEDSVLDFAGRSGIEDIRTFANVFAIAYRKGGDMKDIIRNTYQILNDKMEIDRELRTVTASSRSELNMMMGMPVLLKLFLNTSASGLISQGGSANFLATTGALAIFAVAYMIGRKVCAIKL